MLLEAGGTNNPWTTSGAYTVRGFKYTVTRVSARHGQRFNTATNGTTVVNGSDAYTNFAFFDGHVALYPSFPLFTNEFFSSPNNWVGDPVVNLAKQD